jgi:hypothetical protein
MIFLSLTASNVNFLSSYTAECQVRDETTNINTEDVIMCCVIRVITQLGGGNR